MADRPPRDLNATISYRHDLNDRFCIMRIRPDHGEIAQFEPGQFATIGLPREPEFEVGGSGFGSEGGDVTSEQPQKVRFISRPYSIASSAHNREEIELIVQLVEGGRLTERLWRLGRGGRVWLDEKTRGTFTLGGVPADARLVMVATGAGIAPFMSMYRTFRGQQRWQRFIMIHGVRRVSDLAWRDDLEEAARTDSTFSYVPTLTRESEASHWIGLRGRVQRIMEEEIFLDLFGELLDPARFHVFLCGNPDMIEQVRDMLIPRGFIADEHGVAGNLHFERYWT